MGARLLLTVCFAGLGVAVLITVAAAAFLVARNLPTEVVPVLHELVLAYAGGAAFVLTGIIALLWAYADRSLAQPLAAVVRGLQVVVHANPGYRIEIEPPHHLGALPEACDALVRALAAARADTSRQIETATLRAEQQKNELAAILHDLHEGVLVCTMAHRILLYNRRALQLLHIGREIGLDRSLLNFLTGQAVVHALGRLTTRLAHDPGGGTPPSVSVPFVGSTTDGKHMLQGRMSLIVDSARTPSGYVLSFEDGTEELAALALRDRLLREAAEGFRGPLANLRAAAEILAGPAELSPAEQVDFKTVLLQESEVLGTRLEWLSQQYRTVITGHWPMSDIYSANLLHSLGDRLREQRNIRATIIGLPQWLHGDSYSLLELLDRLVVRLASRLNLVDLDLEAVAGDKRVTLDVVWDGPVMHLAELGRWLDDPMDDLLGGLSLRDILDRHRTDVWVQLDRSGRCRLRLPLPRAARQAQADAATALPARPEFYDFDLLHRPLEAGGRGERALKGVTYVVFDTETTGLQPGEGDEIVALAGVRLVNGRILTGESFERLVNPRRPIPKTSERFHGINDAMVGDKPPIEVVLPQFRAFVGDAVLVAHNAAFDMKFLRLREADSGVSFGGVAVLDTFLLSCFLHDLSARHTLDALAARLGIPIQGRHTALGDSLVTAGCFLKMLDMLAARGVTTLNDALAVCARVVDSISRQARR